MQNLSHNTSQSQQNWPISSPSPLESLIADLRDLRDGLIARDRRQRAAILAGQLALLAAEYQRGRRPSRKNLRLFFRFVAGDVL